MSQNTYSRQQYENLMKQKKKGWAMFYNEMGQNADNATIIISTIGRDTQGKLPAREDIPSHITTQFYDMAVKLNETYTCPVCLELVNKETINISFCGHIFCKDCLEHIKKSDNPLCAICRKKL
jgi:hypothetical protein